MSDQGSAPAPVQDNRRKMTGAQAMALGTGGAGGAATLLWALGCIKGHQFYMPDDALALFWASLLAPSALAFMRKYNHWAGVDDQ